MRFFITIFSNALAIFVAAYLVPGISFTGDLITLTLAGLVMGLINFFLKPILKFLSAPLIVITLGFFIIIINMGLLWLVVELVPELTIQGFWAYFWGVLVISAVNIFVSTLIKIPKRKRIG